MMGARVIRQGAALAVLSAGGALCTFPFAWMLLTGLKTQREAASSQFTLFPAEWQWGNFAETFRAAPFATYFFNSFAVSLAVTAAVIVTALMAGYAFARLEFPGRGPLFAAILATMMVPFEITLIPNYVLITKFGWYNTYWALIVPWCANAFSIFLARQAFMALPADYFDAAIVDGCGHLRFLAWVAAPLAKPAVVTIGLFAFLGSYNALVWPLVVTGDEAMRVVQVGLTVFSGAAGVRINLLMCASAIVILPTVALYFAAQRHFLESFLGTGIKG